LGENNHSLGKERGESRDRRTREKLKRLKGLKRDLGQVKRKEKERKRNREDGIPWRFQKKEKYENERE